MIGPFVWASWLGSGICHKRNFTENAHILLLLQWTNDEVETNELNIFTDLILGLVTCCKNVVILLKYSCLISQMFLKWQLR